jgi:beta-galactosidase
LVRRDRNHPSVVVWCNGNESLELNKPALATEISRRLTNIFHEEDPTRPVTAGSNKAHVYMTEFGTTLDVLGLNYYLGHIPRIRKANPDKPLLASETSSCVSSRGEYMFPVSDDLSEGRSHFQVSSYDLYAPYWARPPDVVFAALDKTPDVAGEFVWTGFDYMGEPTPYNRDLTNLLNFNTEQARKAAEEELARLGRIKPPSRSSYFGIVDLAGFKKDRFYLYQARWRPDLPMAHILPHWTWPERVGQVTPVHVHTSGDEAELFLNGKSLGRRKKGEFEYRLRWDDVVYEPGELKVQAYKEGKPWASAVMQTVGEPARLDIQADRKEITADGRDLAFVTVRVVDAEGRLVPRANLPVRFEVEGAGRLVATDNGDPTDLTVFSSTERKAFNGLALGIVGGTDNQPDTIRLTAKTEGLPPASVDIKTNYRK